MKCIAAILALIATTVTANVLPGGVSVRRSIDSFESFVDLQVEDERFGDRVFSGTAQAIYEEMIALKPELFVDGKLIPADGAAVEKRSETELEKRQKVSP